MPEEFTDDDRAAIRDALRVPRARYSAERAAQLSGVPQRTLYDWASAGVLVPDFGDERPLAWSYRDLVYARVCLWLRSKQMPRGEVAERIVYLRTVFATDAAAESELRSDGKVVTPGDATVDPLTGVQFLDDMVSLAGVFDVLKPVDVPHRATGPHLLRPSPLTAMSPWVQGGEPCVRATRLPTTSLYALHVERDLAPAAIAGLYPGITVAQVVDAIGLESSLHARSVQAA